MTSLWHAALTRRSVLAAFPGLLALRTRKTVPGAPTNVRAVRSN